MFCREQAARFSARADEIEAKGASLHFIGNGTVAMARDFQEKDGVRAALYTDPGRKSYTALGATRSAWSVMHPKAALRSAQVLWAGGAQSATAGDATQQGGELVVRAGGVATFLHLAEFAGDHAEVEAVILAI